MQETTLSTTNENITKICLKRETPDTRFGFAVQDENSKTFFHLCNAVLQCGKKARDNQKLIHRSFKEDGSILTETDLAVSSALIPEISNLYPNCNIVTEEIDLHTFCDNAQFTFILDPIDGTDSYSQGFPSWCIALGILDSLRNPCGGIIYAPRFGIGEDDLFFCSMPYSSTLNGNENLTCNTNLTSNPTLSQTDVFLNGKLWKPLLHYDEPKQITAGSDILNHVDLGTFSGKLRVFGSGILHMTGPFAFSNIDACLTTKCYAWDVAAPHALALKLGFEVVYLDGSPVVYNDSLLKERKRFTQPIIVGNHSCIKYMERMFTQRP